MRMGQVRQGSGAVGGGVRWRRPGDRPAKLGWGGGPVDNRPSRGWGRWGRPTERPQAKLLGRERSER